MTVKQHPGCNKRKVLAVDLPVYAVRKFWSPGGDVTYKNSQGVTQTVAEAEIASHNNQATFYNEITSITGTHIWVEE